MDHMNFTPFHGIDSSAIVFVPITSHPINECYDERLLQSSILGKGFAANTKHETQGLEQSDLGWLGLEGTEVQNVSEQAYAFSLGNRTTSLWLSFTLAWLLFRLR